MSREGAERAERDRGRQRGRETRRSREGQRGQGAERGRGGRGGRKGQKGAERGRGQMGQGAERGRKGQRGQRGQRRQREAERQGPEGEALACETEKAGLTLEGGWEVEVDETRQTEVSPIHFQEGAPLTGAFGEKDKNTNHHPKCTCYFPSGVRNWIVSGVSGKMRQMGWAWSSSPHRQWGKWKCLGTGSWLE